MCCENLMKCHAEKKIVIHAFCLMPNHLHLCVDGVFEKTKSVVDRWKSFTTHESWKHGWKGKLWQERYLPKEINSEKGESEVMEYVLWNPERAGLVSIWKEWPYWAEPPYGKIGWRKTGEAVSGLAPIETKT